MVTDLRRSLAHLEAHRLRSASSPLPSPVSEPQQHVGGSVGVGGSAATGTAEGSGAAGRSSSSGAPTPSSTLSSPLEATHRRGAAQRGGVGPVSSTRPGSGTPPLPAPLRSGSARTPTTSSSTAAGLAGGSRQQASRAATSPGSSTPPSQPLHAANGLTSSPNPPQHQTPQPAASPPPPLLMPMQWRRAVRQYEEVLQGALAGAGGPISRGDRQLGPSSAPEASPQVGGSPGRQASDAGNAPRGPHFSITSGLSRSVAEASGSFNTSLASMYAAVPTSSRCGGKGTLPQADADGREARQLFAAVVAAQTWILNALRQLAAAPLPRKGEKGDAAATAAASVMGISAEGLYRLLQELRVARMQLAEGIDRLQELKQEQRQKEAAPLPGGGSDPVKGGPSGRPGGPAAGGRTGASGSGRHGIDPTLAGGQREEAVKAAVRWRNRFLRAMVAAAGGRGGSSGPRAPGGPPMAASQQQRTLRQGAAPDPINRSCTPPGSRPGSSSRSPTAQASGDPMRGTHHRISSSPLLDAPLLMLRPLGLWLPRACWAPAAAAVQEGSGAVGATATAGATPPWLLALPDWPGSAPTRLHCPELQHALGHSRAQQQLQQCLMQLHLEGVLAAALVPGTAPPSLPPPPQGGGGALSVGRRDNNPHFGGWERAEQAAKLERHIARCRLAHMFLSKGAWNKRCCVVELLEEEGAG